MIEQAEGIYVIGAGGHGKVVIDILRAMGKVTAGVLDDNPACRDRQLLGIPVLGGTNLLIAGQTYKLIVAIGNNATRRALVEKLERKHKIEWITAIHPQTIIAPSVQIGAGCMICAGAVIQPDTIIGRHTIINTATNVDHDNKIGEFVHIAPGCSLTGAVSVGENAFIGAGSTIIPGIHIGNSSIVGAGSAVIRDVAPGSTVAGIPAKLLTQIQ